MKVQHVHVEHYKGLGEMDADLNGRSVYVVGHNASGKTSFIGAIFSALTGKGIPPEPIQAGQREAKIELELDGFMVDLSFKKKGSKVQRKLTVVDTETGEEISDPRRHLNGIIGELDFDPFAFMAMPPKKQLDYFCSIFEIDVKKFDADYQECNEGITYNKRKIVELQGGLSPYDPKHLSLVPQDHTQLLKDYQEALAEKAKLDSFTEKMEAKRKDLKDTEAKIEELKQQAQQLADDLAKGDAWLEGREWPDVEGIKEDLDAVDSAGADVRHAHAMKKIEDEIAEVEKEQEQLAETKKEALGKKRDAIKEHLTKMPGLDYSEDKGFILDGLPFHSDQANTAAQIVAGIKLGASLLGDVKIIRFDGSLLDNNNLEAVGAFAEQEGLQLFVELVDRNAEDLRLEFTENTQASE